MATAHTPSQPMRGEDLYGLDETHHRYELVRGELVALPYNGWLHSVTNVQLSTRIFEFVDANRLGEAYGANTGFVISRNSDTVLAPDASYVRAQRPVGLDGDSYIEGAPDLAVETVDGSDLASYMLDKIMIYLEHGTQQVWIVYPGRRLVLVHHPDGISRTYKEHDTIPGGNLLPGFELPVADIFCSPVSASETE